MAHAEVNDVICGCGMACCSPTGACRDFTPATTSSNSSIAPSVSYPTTIDALLDYNISVTLAQGPDLLVFHHAREHQAFHMGYDYWALTEVLIQESWPLDYILLYELVHRLQDRFKTHLALRLHQFVALRAEAPDNKHLFTLLAALLVRLDDVEEYDGVVESTPPPDRCWKKPDP